MCKQCAAVTLGSLKIVTATTGISSILYLNRWVYVRFGFMSGLGLVGPWVYYRCGSIPGFIPGLYLFLIVLG